MEIPDAFIEQMNYLLGKSGTERLVQSLLEPTPVSIRVNRQKPAFLTMNMDEPVPWSADGCYLKERPSFTLDPLFHAGCYYVQEASSMFLEQVMRCYVQQPVVMLDLCAAPGGKSTQAVSLLPQGSLLVANEVIGSRAKILVENLTKWGSPDVVVTNNDPSAFTPLENLFDVLLADVPCSGEGMFRKDPTAVSEWSPENVTLCWQRQRRILSDVWPALKPGGLLIYSTCTFNQYENEDNIAWIARELGAEVLPVEVPRAWRITGNLTEEDFPVYRFLPSYTRGEGLFMAVLRKHESDYRPYSPKLPKKKEKAPAAALSKEALLQAMEWVSDPDRFDLQMERDTLTAFPKAYSPLLTALRGSLRMLKAGVEVAHCKGQDLQPAHALLLSSIYNKVSLPTAEVTREQAIAYLRKESLTLPDAPRGYVVLTYRHIPLGLVKNLGTRANNLYPAEWRVRKMN